MLQQKLLKKVVELLEENNIEYMVTGSIASSMQGEPRLTHDIDIVINISQISIPLFLNAFTIPDYYISEDAIIDAIKYKSMFNVLNNIDGDKVDFWILTNEDFDISRFARKQKIKMHSFCMNISNPEDTILSKLKWANLAGGSEKQFNDVLSVYELQFGVLNFNYIEKWVKILKVDELWQRIKNEANPIK